MNRPATSVPVSSGCVPNISSRGRRRRLVRGLIVVLATIGLFVFLASRHASAIAFLAVTPLVAVAALYLFQVKEMTCVVLAAKQLKEDDVDKRTARIAQEFLVAVQRQARKVWIETAVATGIVTAGVLGWAFLR